MSANKKELLARIESLIKEGINEIHEGKIEDSSLLNLLKGIEEAVSSDPHYDKILDLIRKLKDRQYSETLHNLFNSLCHLLSSEKEETLSLPASFSTIAGRASGRVFIVEDDPFWADAIKKTAEELDLNVYGIFKCYRDAENNLKELSEGIVILDLSIPKAPGGEARPENGVELLKKLKRKPESSPYVIVLTGFGSLDFHREAIFEGGADDFVAKGPGNLWKARLQQSLIEALQPRPYQHELDIFTSLGLIRVDGVEVELPPRSFTALLALSRNQGRFMKRDQIAEEIRSLSYEFNLPYTRDVGKGAKASDWFRPIRERVRKALKMAGKEEVELIESRRRKGYKLSENIRVNLISNILFETDWDPSLTEALRDGKIPDKLRCELERRLGKTSSIAIEEKQAGWWITYGDHLLLVRIEIGEAGEIKGVAYLLKSFLGRPSLLIVEDEEEWKDKLGEHLNNSGLKRLFSDIKFAPSAEKAMGFLKELRRPLIVVLDLLIPRREGEDPDERNSFELLNSIKEERIRVVVYSGYVNEWELRDRLMKEGVPLLDIIPKGREEELISRLFCAVKGLERGAYVIEQHKRFHVLEIWESRKDKIRIDGKEITLAERKPDTKHTILLSLARNFPNPCSGTYLCKQVWGGKPDKKLPLLRKHISEIRRRIEAAGINEEIIQSRKGGYWLHAIPEIHK